MAFKLNPNLVVGMYKETVNQKLIKQNMATIEVNATKATIYLNGYWVWSSIDEKQLMLELTKLNQIKAITIDGSKIEALDTIGAYFITQIEEYLAQHHIEIVKLSLPENEHEFFKLIAAKLKEPEVDKAKKPRGGLITAIGRDTFHFSASLLAYLTFFGQLCINFIQLLKAPRSLNWQEVARTVNDAGLKGVWVAAILCFLIGMTLAYEMSPQFITYGANVYIVNFLGISLLKEVAPLLTAIIVAGRTGASITAELGVMKVQEEIDAIQTMGISPLRRLVLPKVIGVMIAVPLITAIADIASMLGGAIIANTTLEVNYDLFISRMQTYVSINNYTCGIIKSVAFAFAIGLTGCFCGFNVKGNANSIGEQTTKSVVLGIILVVIIDAIFAMIFKTLGV